jgi:hypothetical protein
MVMRVGPLRIVGVVLAGIGCQNVLGLTTETIVETSASPAAALGDGGAGYHALDAPANWAAFDVNTLYAGTQGFKAATFDGRYVYLVPTSGNLVLRYDTSGTSLSDPNAWTTKNTENATDGGALIGDLVGAAFDGRYVYFAGANAVVRLDTQIGAVKNSVWSCISGPSLAGDYALPANPAGTVFDGRFLYLVPSQGLTVTSFDTSRSFAEETFNLPTTAGSSNTYRGALFDGRFLYLLPANSDQIVRFDTKASFLLPKSWVYFQAASLSPAATGFKGGAFDGRAIYLVTGSSLIVRYDTTADFPVSSSWSVFNAIQGRLGPIGPYASVFDGRYMYFLPGSTSEVARYDTASGFGDATSWTFYDTAQVNQASGNFVAGVFDGRFVYMIPSVGGVVVRFEARQGSHFPALPDFSGSFL